MSQQNYAPWMEDPTKQYINKDIPPQPRTIVAAACRCVKSGLILVGARHWSPVMHQQAEAVGCSPSSRFDQGFIDQYDQYVSREDAKRIARANKQNLVGSHSLHQLYSEDLY